MEVSKVGDHIRERPEGSFFNSYYTKVLGGASPFPRLLHFTLEPSGNPRLLTIYNLFLSNLILIIC